MPQLPSIKRFDSSSGVRVYRIPCDVFPGITGRVHLLLGAGPPTLVDAGSGLSPSSQQIVSGLESIADEFGEDFRPQQIERILITHAHIDHIGGLSDMVELTGARVGVHVLDTRVVTSWDERAVIFNYRLTHFLRQAGVPAARHPALIEAFGFTEGRVQSAPVDFELSENEPLDGVRVIHTPGHSPGHVCFLVGDILLSGDHILARTVPQQWPESMAGYTGLGHYLESLEKIRRIDGITVTLGGHEPPVRSIGQRIGEILASHERRLDRVTDLVERSSAPPSVAEITRRMYSRQHGFYEFLALFDVGSRVEYLEQRGRLEIANLDEVRQGQEVPLRFRTTSVRFEPTTDAIAPRENTA